MSIFGDDKLQDQRIDALEAHVRSLTQAVHANQADLAEAQILILKLQSQLGEKVGVTDVDPAMAKLNEELGKAREELERSKAAASETWATMQADVNDAFESLCTRVQDAYGKAGKD